MKYASFKFKVRQMMGFSDLTAEVHNLLIAINLIMIMGMNVVTNVETISQ